MTQDRFYFEQYCLSMQVPMNICIISCLINMKHPLVHMKQAKVGTYQRIESCLAFPILYGLNLEIVGLTLNITHVNLELV